MHFLAQRRLASNVDDSVSHTKQKHYQSRRYRQILHLNGDQKLELKLYQAKTEAKCSLYGTLGVVVLPRKSRLDSPRYYANISKLQTLLSSQNELNFLLLVI